MLLRNNLQKDFFFKDFDFQNKVKDKYEMKVDEGDKELLVVFNFWIFIG